MAINRQELTYRDRQKLSLIQQLTENNRQVLADYAKAIYQLELIVDHLDKLDTQSKLRQQLKDCLYYLRCLRSDFDLSRDNENRIIEITLALDDAILCMWLLDNLDLSQQTNLNCLLAVTQRLERRANYLRTVVESEFLAYGIASFIVGGIFASAGLGGLIVATPLAAALFGQVFLAVVISCASIALIVGGASLLILGAYLCGIGPNIASAFNGIAKTVENKAQASPSKQPLLQLSLFSVAVPAVEMSAVVSEPVLACR